MICKLLNRMGTNIILEKKNNNSIQKAIELMKTGCRDNLDLSEIAHSVSMSPALFSIKFKKITGLSPYIYYINIKLFFDKFGITPKQFQLKFYSNAV